LRLLWLRSRRNRGPVDEGGGEAVGEECNDHLCVCRENGRPHTIMGLLRADPNSYNK
jgi:hypothetical protein